MTTSELEIWKALNELPKVQVVFGEWIDGDIGIEIKSKIRVLICRKFFIAMGRTSGSAINDMPDGAVIWLPPIYDPIRPERCLWHLSQEIRENWTPSDKILFAIMKRPDLALAKAILEQKEKG